MLCDEADEIGRKTILHADYPGSIKYYQEEFRKSMIMAKRFGPPDLFITITFGSDNQDLKNAINVQLPDGEHLQQQTNFRPDMVARAFELIYDDFINLIWNNDDNGKPTFGKVACYSAVNEWQMRGNPHGHALFTLENQYKLRTTDDIDKFIRAEIPDPVLEPELHALCTKYMIHGPCGLSSACWNNKINCCKKNFPYQYQDSTKFREGGGKPLYKRSNNGITYKKGNFEFDNRYVVPYSPYLLLKYKCHINIEAVSGILLYKYLYKYTYKGPSKGNFNLVEEERNEILEHLEARIVSAQEAFHRIYGFHLQRKSHAVIDLKLHLENEQQIYWDKQKDTAEKIKRKKELDTQLTAFFKLCRESVHSEFAKKFRYWEIVEHFTWHEQQKMWAPTKKGIKTDIRRPDEPGSFYKKSENLGRIYEIYPSQVELYHLRILLLHVPGPTSFEFLRTVDDTTYQTYQEACLKRGLTTDDKEWERALNDAKLSSMPRNMRLLFVNILINCNPVKPFNLWEMFKDALSEDYLYALKVNQIEDQELKQKTEELAFQKAYADIANLYLTEKAMPITLITGMPEPNLDLNDLLMTIDTVQHKNITETMFASMNEKQKEFFTMIQEASNEENPHKTCFYLIGAAGTGKTFCYLAIYHDLMSRGKLVKNMASTAMAADLLPTGRTVHFTAGIRPPIDDRSITKFSKNTIQGKHLIATKLFIWDEAPMADRYLLETFDRSLQELCNNRKPFGGKLIILGGDFRQCAPVVKEGTKAQIIGQSIKKCDLWKHFRPSFKLTENQRVEPEEIEFLEALTKLGDGELQDNDEGEFEFPEECISDNVLRDVYGTALATKNYESLHERVILTPYNKDANTICEEVLSFIEGQEKVYTSVDILAKDNNLTNTESYPPEILNAIEMNSMPNHELILKINAIIMLIRNLNSSQGHNNGTRIIVTELKDNIIEGKILTGDRKGAVGGLRRNMEPSDAFLQTFYNSTTNLPNRVITWNYLHFLQEMPSLLNKRAPSSSARGVRELAVGTLGHLSLGTSHRQIIFFTFPWMMRMRAAHFLDRLLDQPPQLKSVSNRIVCYKEMPKKPSPVLEQAKPGQPMDQMPQPNVPPWPFRFGLVYNILTCFDRRELCYLRNIDHRHYTVIERKFGTTPPYLVSNGQRLSKSSWKWWPPLGESIEEMPTDVRDQLPTSKFVRFKSSEMLVYNPNESNIDVLSLSHVWENQTLALSCAKDFAWNEEWAHVAAKAKHLDVLNGQGSITYLRQLTSDNCVRLSLRDSTDTLDTVELPWDHILDFLLQPNPEDTKIIQINSDNPFNQHQVETLEFIKQAKQKFLDSPDSVHFTFAWESLSNDNPITFDGLDAPNNGPVFDDFIVQNRRTKQRLRFRSTVQEFRLAVEDQ